VDRTRKPGGRAKVKPGREGATNFAAAHSNDCKLGAPGAVEQLQADSSSVCQPSGNARERAVAVALSVARGVSGVNLLSIDYVSIQEANLKGPLRFNF